MRTSYQFIKAIGRDLPLEEALGLNLVEPQDAQWESLIGEIERAARFLEVKALQPIRPNHLLGESLTPSQREAIDRAYIARYAEALEKDEEPRERMNFEECGEKMTDLKAVLNRAGLSVTWSSRPFTAACGEYAGKPRIFWARGSVATLFARAVAAFNHIGLVPQVEDGFRPFAVQSGLYRARVQNIRQQSPFLSEAEVLREAAAKTAAAPYRAAHMGGAAIDFTLRDLEGRPLDLGNPYPGGGAATILDFPYVTWDQFRTRQLFALVSEMAGLCPYPGENWHVSKGDGLAAIMDGISTIRYCCIRDFDRVSGAIVPYDPQQSRIAFPSE